MRIFVATTLYNMEKSLFLDTLESMGHEVIHHGWDFEETYTKQWLNFDKLKSNLQMVNKAIEEHRKKPINLFFGYLSNRTVRGGIIEEIKQETDIPCVNFSWDDRFKVQMQSEIACSFDLCWTTDKRVRLKGIDISSIEAYRLMGAKAIYLPGGANPDLFKPPEKPITKKKYPISFVGSGGGGYDYRNEIIDELKKEFGDKLFLWGGITGKRITTVEYIDIIHNSLIILGFSGAAGTDHICAPGFMVVKGRDFEIPMAGGFYLTEHNPDLEELYRIGKEIETYDSIENLIEKINHYLKYPEEAQRTARAGCRRARRDHTMQKRFEVIFDKLGLEQ